MYGTQLVAISENNKTKLMVYDSVLGGNLIYEDVVDESSILRLAKPKIFIGKTFGPTATALVNGKYDTEEKRIVLDSEQRPITLTVSKLVEALYKTNKNVFAKDVDLSAPLSELELVTVDFPNISESLEKKIKNSWVSSNL